MRYIFALSTRIIRSALCSEYADRLFQYLIAKIATARDPLFTITHRIMHQAHQDEAELSIVPSITSDIIVDSEDNFDSFRT